MYIIEYLLDAKKDLDDIVYYLSNKLNKKEYALKFIELYEIEEKNILQFPFSYPVFNICSDIGFIYRLAKIEDYLVFFSINSTDKIITIVRVLYSKRNIDELL